MKVQVVVRFDARQFKRVVVVVAANEDCLDVGNTLRVARVQVAGRLAADNLAVMQIALAVAAGIVMANVAARIVRAILNQ